MKRNEEPILLTLLYDVSVVMWIVFLLAMPVIVALLVSGCAPHHEGARLTDAGQDVGPDVERHVDLRPWCPDPSPASTCPPGKTVTGDPPVPPDQQ